MDRTGLVTYYVLFVIDIGLRAVEIAGITRNPDDAFMAQVGRNLTDHLDGCLRGKRFLIVDKDTKFSARFRAILEAAVTKVLRTSFQAPNMNAFAERFLLSVKSECLDKMILFGEASLRRALREFCGHYHHERPHQGIGNELIYCE